MADGYANDDERDFANRQIDVPRRPYHRAGSAAMYNPRCTFFATLDMPATCALASRTAVERRVQSRFTCHAIEHLAIFDHVAGYRDPCVVVGWPVRRRAGARLGRVHECTGVASALSATGCRCSEMCRQPDATAESGRILRGEPDTPRTQRQCAASATRVRAPTRIVALGIRDTPCPCAIVLPWSTR